MGILVWGYGKYYKEKEQSIPQENVVAYISSKESGKWKGVDIISPRDISKYQYDCLYIMTAAKALFEILDELRRMDYQSWDKIILGCNVPPHTEEEKFLLEDAEIRCTSKGRCVYCSSDFVTEINDEQEWNELKQRKVRCNKKNVLADIPLNPISNIFGFERGCPVDRYYIEKFLKENSRYIKGNVLEVASREYTLKYGTGVEKSYSMHVCDADGEDGIVANLETGEGIVDNLVDCFIQTQTLPFIFNVQEAAQNTVRFLKKGGVALVTVSGITQISRYDMERWGHYWNFTTASLKKLFEMCDDVESVEVGSYGNVKSAASGLYGLSVEDMEDQELMQQDDDYQQIITAIIKKCGDNL